MKKLSLLALLLVSAACSALPPILIDTDMASDDWSAILYLLNRRDVKVVAITVPGTGEAHCDWKGGHPVAAVNALGLIQLAGRSKDGIPVACGPTVPMRGNHVFPDEWRTESDAVFGLKLPSSSQSPQKVDAVDLIVSTLEASPKKVRILALGPLTDLGLALMRQPSLASHIDSIVIMGGAVKVPGNLDDPGSTIKNNRFAEWNIYIDPHSAQLVFQSGVPIELVSLDGTNQVPLTSTFLSRLQRTAKTPSAKFVYDSLSKEKPLITSGKYFFWDSLAAAVAVSPEICQSKSYQLSVVETEGPDSGRTSIDPKGHPVSVCEKSNGPKFRELFLKGINGRLP